MQIKEYPNIGERLYSATLPNGLRVFVVPKPGFSSCYAVFAANYGGAHRRFELGGELRDTPAGVAHFLEHKMFDLPGGDSALNILSQNGASPNAFTSAGNTCYYFQCTEGFEENLRMLLHFVSTPYFTDETVSKEQGIIAQEIRMGEDNPGVVLYYDIMRMLFAHHPIRDRVAGTVESIGQIDAKTLYDCHRAFYAPSNMVLCVEGDVDAEAVERIALEVLPAELMPIPKADFGEKEGLLPSEQLHTQQMQVSLPLFYIGAKLKCESGGARFMRQQLIAALSLRILAGSSSRLFTSLYSRGLLNQDFDYEADFTAGAGSVLLGGESVEPETVLEELKAEVKRISREGLDPEEFSRAKRAALGSRLRELEDFDSVCVSMALGVFDGYQILDAVELLESIELDECRKFITESLSARRLAMSVIEPKKG